MELWVRFCLLEVTLDFVSIWSREATVAFVLPSSLDLGFFGNAGSHSLSEFDTLFNVSWVVWLVSLWADSLLHIILFVLSLSPLVLVWLDSESWNRLQVAWVVGAWTWNFVIVHISLFFERTS